MRFWIYVLLFCCPLAYAGHALDYLHLPLGFHIKIYAQGLPRARQLALGDHGIVFVGSSGDKVYAVVPRQGHKPRVVIIARGLASPHGVAFYHGDLYIAAINEIVKLPNIEQHLAKPPQPIVITSSLPKKRWHGMKTIHIGPDGWLYVAIGMPCNSCQQQDPRFGTIMRMRLNGQDQQIIERGIRNTVGFTWQPVTHVLWFSDNAQDWLGDNYPPDEINRAPRANMNFGFPYYIDNNQPAPKFGDLKPVAGMTAPAFELPAHVAPLGVTFYQGHQFPASYQQHLFIAEHGSWNRTRKIGYRISELTIHQGKASDYQRFAYGWLDNNQVKGRPVDILNMPDGSLLVSDDYNGVLYKIYYKKAS